nr:immunoglobulin light chain junction region [Macaca mulatta]MOY09153.1 immunoglobulin light chain junction region [Macaca mulatta]
DYYCVTWHNNAWVF